MCSKLIWLHLAFMYLLLTLQKDSSVPESKISDKGFAREAQTPRGSDSSIGQERENWSSQRDKTVRRFPNCNPPSTKMANGHCLSIATQLSLLCSTNEIPRNQMWGMPWLDQVDPGWTPIVNVTFLCSFCICEVLVGGDSRVLVCGERSNQEFLKDFVW
jgi:hypothetical protein